MFYLGVVNWFDGYLGVVNWFDCYLGVLRFKCKYGVFRYCFWLGEEIKKSEDLLLIIGIKIDLFKRVK